MNWIQRLSVKQLYLLRGAAVAGSGALILSYYLNNRKTTGIAFPAKQVSTLRDDLPISIQAPECRREFVKRVYGVVGIQLGAVALSTCLAFRYSGFRRLFTPGVAIASFIGCIGSIIALRFPSVRQSEAKKKGVLGAFTLFEALSIPFAILPYPKALVLSAVVNTGAIVGGVTLAANATKKDFTMFGGLISGLLLGFLATSVLMLFYPSAIGRTLGGYAGAALFSFCLLHDTQKLLGKGQCKYLGNEWDIASLNIYLDVINILLQILQIMGSNKK